MSAQVTGMGFKAYLGPAFNKLDFFIVVTSALDMAGLDEAFCDSPAHILICIENPYRENKWK